MNRFALFAAGIVMAAVLTGGSTAHAHNDQGIFSVDSADASQPATVHLLVTLIYSGDQDPAITATVTATAVSPAGEVLTPVPLTLADQLGHYAGTVTTPSGGNWTIRLAALDPVATLDLPVTVVSPTTTTTPPTTTTTPPTTSTGSVVPAASRSDSSSNTGLLIVAALALAIVVGGYLVFRATRRGHA